MKKGEVVAFADDILLICDDKEDAEKLIQTTASLQKYGLKLNKAVSAILTDN